MAINLSAVIEITADRYAIQCAEALQLAIVQNIAEIFNINIRYKITVVYKGVYIADATATVNFN